MRFDTAQRPAGSVNPRRPANKDGKPPTIGTLQGYVKVIKAWFPWLVDEEVIAKNPAQRLEKPQGGKRIMVSFSDEHLNRLFGVCDLETALGFRDYTLMLVLLDTGIRVDELCHIPVDDVHESFTNIRGMPLTPSGVEQIFDKVRDAAGVTDVLVSPHELRHTFARIWLERGGDTYSLSRLLGHSSVKFTEIYQGMSARPSSARAFTGAN
jgi:site-specific recombinase XerD